MKGKRDPRFQQVYSPPFIFVRKSFQDVTTIPPSRFLHIPSSWKGLFGVSTTINPNRFLHIPSFGGAWGGTPFHPHFLSILPTP